MKLPMNYAPSPKVKCVDLISFLPSPILINSPCILQIQFEKEEFLPKQARKSLRHNEISG